MREGASWIAEQGYRLKVWAGMHAELEAAMGAEWYTMHLKQIAARVTDTEPTGSRCLTVSDYLEAKGLSQSETHRLASSFGKRVKALYVAQHGKTPPKVKRLVGGTERDVVAYSQDDLPLFDRAFAEISLRLAA